VNTSTIAAVLIVGGSTALRVAYDPRVSDKPGAMGKIAVGGFALGALLTLIGAGAPGVSAVLATLLILASLILNGPAIATATSALLGK